MFNVVNVSGLIESLTEYRVFLIPNTDDDIDLGSSSKEFKDLYIDGTANIDSLVADTADINGGTIDGVIIGGGRAVAPRMIDTATATPPP